MDRHDALNQLDHAADGSSPAGTVTARSRRRPVTAPSRATTSASPKGATGQIAAGPPAGLQDRGVHRCHIAHIRDQVAAGRG